MYQLRRITPMAVRFAATINAFNRGIEDAKPAAAVSLIEDWETALADVDVPGAKGIARDLASLRKQLESGSPDGERVSAIVARLGEAVTRIASRADKNSDKLTNLGEALTESGSPQDDEEIDEAAAAAPRRKKAA
jgi:uncharacterized protein YmfQ (DUF2313 family)